MEIKLERILKNVTTLPVLDIAYPNIFPCITYHFYLESGALFGLGIAEEEKASCQIDVWYKKKTSDIKAEIKKIKQAIVDEKLYSFPNMETTQETGTKIYHTHINFELVKESEE